MPTSDAAPVLRLYDTTTRDWLAPMGADVVVWSGAQVARAELLALVLAALLLLLLGLNLWLLVDRARRRRAERELFARLAVLETDRARAQMAAAAAAGAGPSERGVVPLPVVDGRPARRSAGRSRADVGLVRR